MRSTSSETNNHSKINQSETLPSTAENGILDGSIAKPSFTLSSFLLRADCVHVTSFLFRPRRVLGLLDDSMTRLVLITMFLSLFEGIKSLFCHLSALLGQSPSLYYDIT